jgi:hypothetical protein
MIPLTEILKTSLDLLSSDSQCQFTEEGCNKTANSQNKDGLGDDPHIPPPILEDIPTVPMILNPIFGLFPSLKNYHFSPAAQCPTATFNVLGRVFVLDQHCVVNESMRAFCYAFASLCWAFVSLRIILKS